MNYSLISTLKPFKKEGHVDWAQETALFSWSLVPNTEVVIVGADDERGRALIEQYEFGFVPHVLRGHDVGYFSQAPIITDMIRLGLDATSAQWIALINADITLLPEFSEQLDSVMERIDLSQHPDPFITVRRRDYTITKPLVSEEDLRALDQSQARLHKVTGSDIFLTTRAFWEKTLASMPPFIYGRFSWDVFFHRHAVLNASLAVDASNTVICYHAYHGSIVDRTNPEIVHNLMMYEAHFADEVFDLNDPRWVRM